MTVKHTMTVQPTMTVIAHHDCIVFCPVWLYSTMTTPLIAGLWSWRVSWQETMQRWTNLQFWERLLNTSDTCRQDSFSVYCQPTFSITPWNEGRRQKHREEDVFLCFRWAGAYQGHIRNKKIYLFGGLVEFLDLGIYINIRQTAVLKTWSWLWFSSVAKNKNNNPHQNLPECS